MSVVVTLVDDWWFVCHKGSDREIAECYQ